MKIPSKKNIVGFTYLGVLFIITILGITLALAGTLYSFTQQREKERQLLFVGNQFKQAIGLYYQRTPGYIKRYPVRLEYLLQDNRFVSVQRHLRKIYTDPMTKSQDWGLVNAPDGGIMGVYSKSTDFSLKVSGFEFANINLPNKPRYSDWQFIYDVPVEQKVLTY
ncbi:MAG: type II secretion system protein [Methylotenera sp.]|uniref:type II secretion system protein n=1 Tax=Methylotenera sp. TaxID=2051956 RepID=UPI0017EACEEC|nr:type II secretion system protein [Methylotenera sp.]NOU26027.1 type II secretion system protein [Methylotenera sp.]